MNKLDQINNNIDLEQGREEKSNSISLEPIHQQFILKSSYDNYSYKILRDKDITNTKHFIRYNFKLVLQRSNNLPKQQPNINSMMKNQTNKYMRNVNKSQIEKQGLLVYQSIQQIKEKHQQEQIEFKKNEI